MKIKVFTHFSYCNLHSFLPAIIILSLYVYFTFLNFLSIFCLPAYIAMSFLFVQFLFLWDSTSFHFIFSSSRELIFLHKLVFSTTSCVLYNSPSAWAIVGCDWSARKCLQWKLRVYWSCYAVKLRKREFNAIIKRNNWALDASSSAV